jgi:LCP family protein required for cell wall assembly
MNTTRTSRKKKRTPKWLRITIFTLFILLIGGGLYFYNVYNDIASAVDKMNKPISREVSKKREAKVEFKQQDPISILMVGVDEREGDKGRTDSMLVITVNPEKKTTKILSIPRDTRTKLINNNNPSKNRLDKINAAYAYGGIEESIDTVENFLNVPIDYYIKVNMEGFKDIVNAVGGIDVDNKYAFELDGVTLKTGPQHLNGTKALQYARMRKQDPRGDFGREERQREVISKIIDKGKSLSTLTKYDDILGALENNIQTNLTLTDIIGIQSKYKPAAETIDKLEIKGQGDTINRLWYFLVDDETRQSLSDQFREHLGLQQEMVAKIPGLTN